MKVKCKIIKHKENISISSQIVPLDTGQAICIVLGWQTHLSQLRGNALVANGDYIQRTLSNAYVTPQSVDTCKQKK